MIESNQTLAAANRIKPTNRSSCAVWIDANDYAVGTFANGATITNKGNNGATFVVVGTTLEVQLDGSGNKEFEFNGSFIRCSSASSTFTKYHDLNTGYTVQFIGKLGTSSNPNDFFFVYGNNAGSSVNIGSYLFLDNRTTTAAGNRGVTRAVTKGSSGNTVYNSLHLNGAYNVDQSLFLMLTSGSAISAIDNDFLVKDGDIVSVYDRTRTTANTTIRASGRTNQEIASQYILGGLYAKNADRSKTILLTSRGTDHFAVGTNRDGVQIISTDDGITWPTSYSAVFTDATKTVMPPYGGYNTGTNTLIAVYGKWTTATGVYTDLIARRSTDGGTTWGSEITITLPVTSPVLTSWLPHDQLVICNNGDIMMPMYAVSTTALYKIYVMKSSDDGLTWAFKQVYSSGSVYIAEPSGCSLGGGNHLIWGRVEVAAGGVFKYQQFFSNDDGETWSDQGATPFGGAMFAHPAMLRSFNIDGTLVVEASWVNRLNRRMYCKYAKASSIVSNGISEWTAKTVYQVYEGFQGYDVGWETGYPFFIHSRDDLNMQGVWFEETSATDTTSYLQYFNDELKATIKTELGI